MLKFFLLTLLFAAPLFSTGQTLYEGKSHSKIEVAIQINPDSTFIFVQKHGNQYYDEFRGQINQLNDSVYHLSGKRYLMQAICRAIGDSLLYVQLDSTALERTRALLLTYSNKQSISLLDHSREAEFTVPINTDLFNPQSGKDYFNVYAGYLNPITGNPVKTTYTIHDEFCFTLYAGGNPLSLDIIVNKKTLKYREDPNIIQYTVLKKK